METSDASLEAYRRAVAAHPELDPLARGGPAAEARSGSSDDARMVDAAADTLPAAAATSQALPVQAFPPEYEVVERIAETRLSRTWKVFHKECKVHLVLKEPLAAVALDPEAMERFRLEVQLVARLWHPNIVPLSATHLQEPPYFYTMPFVEGEHLNEHCARTKLNLAGRVRLFLRICHAVTYAHQHGVLHRDLKPRNILVDDAGQPHVLDFGLGRILETDEPPGAATGSVVGTPGYMAPEQAAGLLGDTRTDVYALGVILYELVTGVLPVEPVRDFEETCRRIRELIPVPPEARHRAVGRELSAIIIKALAKSPDARYSGAGDLARDVESMLACRPVSALTPGAAYRLRQWIRRNWLAAGVSTFVALGILAFTVFAAVLWRARAAATERGRHYVAVLSGRYMVKADDPVNAARTLWAELLRYDTPRTRYALWQFYRRYPCVLNLPADGTDSRPMDVEYSPDGRYLVSVWSTGELRVCDALDGRCTGKPARTADGATRAKFLPPEPGLVVGYRDGSLRLWDLTADGQLLPRDDRALWQGPGTITSLAVSHSGHWLAATSGSSVCLLDRFGGRAVRHTWVDVAPEPLSLAFSPDGRQLGIGTGGIVVPPSRVPVSGIDVWNPADDTVVDRIGTTGHVRDLCFSADGAQLFYGSDDLGVYTLAERKLDVLRESYAWGLRSIDLSPDPHNRYLAFAGGDGRIRYLDLIERAELDVGGYHDAIANHVDLCFSPDGQFVASAGPDGLRVWRFPPLDGSLLSAPSGQRVEKLDISPAGTWVVAQCIDAKGAPAGLTVWQRGPGEAVPSLLDSDAVCPPALSPDEQHLAFGELTPEGDPAIRVVSLRAPSSAGPRCALPGLRVARLRWITPELLVLGCIDGLAETGQPARGSLRLGVLADNQLTIRTLREFENPCENVATSADGRWLAACAGGNVDVQPPVDGCVVLFEVRQTPAGGDGSDSPLVMRTEFAVPAGTWFVSLVQNDSGERRVVTGGAARVINVWDLASGQHVGELKGHRDFLDGLHALPGGLMVSSSRDGSVRVWDVWQSEEICTLHEGAGLPVLAVCNGRIAIGAGETVTIADTRDIERFIAANRAVQGFPLAQRIATGQVPASGDK